MYSLLTSGASTFFVQVGGWSDGIFPKSRVVFRSIHVGTQKTVFNCIYIYIYLYTSIHTYLQIPAHATISMYNVYTVVHKHTHTLYIYNTYMMCYWIPQPNIHIQHDMSDWVYPPRRRWARRSRSWWSAWGFCPPWIWRACGWWSTKWCCTASGFRPTSGSLPVAPGRLTIKKRPPFFRVKPRLGGQDGV